MIPSRDSPHLVLEGQDGGPAMRHLVRLSLLTLVFTGCSKEPRPPVNPAPEEGASSRDRKPDTPAIPVSDPGPRRPLFAESPLPEPAAQDKYDAALLDAVDRMAEKKYEQALVAMEAARAAQDTEQ